MADMTLVEQLTALEVARRSQSPDPYTIIELMSIINTMLRELPATQANDGAIHSSVIRTSYPHGTHRVYNQGVKLAASQTKPQKDKIAMLQSYARTDARMAAHAGNENALYNTENFAFVYGMGLDQADDMIYGSEANDPAEINGLATRIPKGHPHFVDANTEASLGGQVGDPCTSIYLVAAGPQACHIIYPKGSTSAGVSREIKPGTETVNDADGNPYEAHVELFTAEYGLCIEHPDAVIRLANIPLNLDKTKRAELVELMLWQQMNLTVGITNEVAFMNKKMLYQIQRAARELEYVVHPEKDPWGLEVEMVNDLRMRRQDAILNTEVIE
jgi:hypothetical protein